MAAAWLVSGAAAPAQTGSDYLTGLVFDALTYQNGVLCWKADCLINDPVTRIQRTASGGSEIHTYYQPATCEGSRVRSRNLAVDAARRVFWATGDGRIVTLPQEAVPGTAPTVLATLENNAASSVYVAISRDFVYWAETFGEVAESGKIFRAPIGGGARAEVAALSPAGGGGATWLAAATVATSPFLPATEVVYYRRSFGVLAKSWLRIVAPWTTDTIAPSVQGVAAAGGRIWFAESNAAGASAIRSLPMNNSLTTTLHAGIPQNGNPEVRSLAADAEAVYWHETRSGSGPIVRRFLAGGTVSEAISANLPLLPFETGLVSDGRHLMWGSGGGVRQTTIRRLPVNSAAVTWNLAADSLELVQAIQNPFHDVPLVSGKPAWARLRGHLASASSGAQLIASGAALRGFVDGAELPGSPLSPALGTGIASIVPHERARTEDGWWFQVPASWMRNRLELRATVNADGAIIETTADDNEVVEVFEMTPRQGIAIWMHPVRTRFGVIRDWKPEYQALEDLVEAVLPTHSFNIMFAPGPEIEEWEGPFPWSFGPYELSDADNDSYWVFAKLIYRRLLFAIPDLLRTSRIHHGAFFHAAPGQDFLGRGLYRANILVSAMDLGGDDLNRPKGALTLAHEIGHNFNRRHVDCGGPDDLDGGFPYPPCQLDFAASDFVNQGFNPLARRVIAFNRAGDLMSYADTMWPSDYTWQALFGDLDDVPSDAPRAVAPAAAATGRRILVIGGVAPDGTARLEPALVLPDQVAIDRAQALVAGAADPASHRIRVRGGNGEVLATVPAAVLEGSESGLLPVVAVLDEDDAAEQFELATAGDPDIVLASFSGGSAPPSVEITAPGPGTVAAGTLPVRWIATDPDGDPMWFAVRYSSDGGASWRILADDLRHGELEVPLDGLPGGPPGQALIEVMASDGIRTGTARSAPFTVPPGPPELSAVIETPGERHCTVENPVLRAGEPVAFHASGRDPEDGIIAEEAIGWTLVGPRAMGGAGPSFVPGPLPPGTYVATASASDRDGTDARADLAFTIAPLRVEDLAAPPVVDGVPEVRSKPAPTPPIPIPYPNGRSAGVALARNGGFLYVTVCGIPIAGGGSQQVVVSADPGFDGGASPGPDDLRFIAGANGFVATERGNGAGFVRDASPVGLTARVASNGVVWHAELQIALSRLGAWDGRSIGLDVAAGGHRWFSGEEAAAEPSRWAVVELAADIDPRRDDDVDGMPDAWERLHFGGLGRDGTGDLDEDGLTDVAEYQTGTDPASAASHFEVVEGLPTADGIEIRWDARAGHCYDVEVSTDLAGFTTVAADLPGTDGEMTFVVPWPVDEAGGRVLCRVRVRRVVP